MGVQREATKHLCLTILCCLVPLAVMAAAVFLRTPTLPATVMGMLLLIPIGHALLAEPSRPQGELRQERPFRTKPR
jgi:hypothetical protein